MLQLWLLSIATIGCAIHDDATITLADGSQWVGAMQHIDRQGATILVDGQSREIALSQLRSYSCGKLDDSREPGIELHLVAESVIAARRITLSDRVITADFQSGSTLELDCRYVRAVVLQPGSVAKHSIQWQELADHPKPLQDLLVVERNGRLDAIDGLVREIGADALQVQVESGTVSIPCGRLSGIIFRQAASPNVAKPTAAVTLRGGSRLNCNSLNGSAETIHTQLADGPEIELAASDVVEIDFAPGRHVPFAELQPLRIDWEPLLANASELTVLQSLNAPRFNRSFRDEPLRIFAPEPNPDRRELQFDQGIAVRGGTRLVYALNGQYAPSRG